MASTHSAHGHLHWLSLGGRLLLSQFDARHAGGGGAAAACGVMGSDAAARAAPRLQGGPCGARYECIRQQV